MIIVLNGTSSAGKSTLAREIMRESDRPFIYYSIDHLVNYWMDEKFVAIGKEPNEWFYHESVIDDLGNLLTQIVDGPKAVQLHWDMIDALAVLIKKGYDMIIDEIFWNPDILRRYVPALAISKKVYLVKVNCNLITCEQREKKRDDRYQGLARALQPQVNANFPLFDVEADTTYTEPKKIAQAILNFVEAHPKPRAFIDILKANINIKPLTNDDFPKLQQWINHTPNWNEGHEWTLQDILQKYFTYLKGYKESEGERKTIRGYIIYCAQHPIGYIQFYNAYDFPRDGYVLKNFPTSMAAVDLLIGDPDYKGKGLGATVVQLLLNQEVWQLFSSCLVDPDTENEAAIRAYEKAGFTIQATLKKPPVTLMVQHNPQNRLTAD